MDAIAVRDVLLERQAHSGNIVRSVARGGDQPWRQIPHQRVVGKKSLKLRPALPQHKPWGIRVEAQKQPPNLAALFELDTKARQIFKGMGQRIEQVQEREKLSLFTERWRCGEQ